MIAPVSRVSKRSDKLAKCLQHAPSQYSPTSIACLPQLYFLILTQNCDSNSSHKALDVISLVERTVSLYIYNMKNRVI